MTDNELKRQAYDSIRKDVELSKEQLAKQTAWQRYLATSATALFGILVALTDIRTAPWPARFLFAVVVVLLALSILALSIGLYADKYYLDRGRDLQAAEARKAFAEKRQQEYIAVPRKKVFALCTTIGTVGLILSLLVLCGYVLLLCFR